MNEPPRWPRPTSIAWAGLAFPVGTPADARRPPAASGSERTKRCERAKAARSCARVRPGWDGKVPSAAGIVVIWPGTRRGRIFANVLGPKARRAARLSSSSPSPVGIVRASNTPMRSESRTLQGRSGIFSALNSSGRSAGVWRTWSIHALTPAA